MKAQYLLMTGIQNLIKIGQGIKVCSKFDDYILMKIQIVLKSSKKL
jgi:hypothetical protein